MSQKPDNNLPPFVGNPFAPDWFADEATGVFTHSGMVRLTFEAWRANHDAAQSINRVIVGRLVLPVESAMRLRDLLVMHLGPGSTQPPKVQ